MEIGDFSNMFFCFNEFQDFDVSLCFPTLFCVLQHTKLDQKHHKHVQSTKPQQDCISTQHVCLFECAYAIWRNLKAYVFIHLSHCWLA